MAYCPRLIPRRGRHILRRHHSFRHVGIPRTMMQPGFPALSGLAILLLGTITSELHNGVTDGVGVIASTLHPSLILAKPVEALPVLDKDWQLLADGILARPLFAATRRPLVAPAASAPSPVKLPRLAGILIIGHSRSAVFAAVGEERPLVVQEGAKVGNHTVQSIEAGQVTLLGPDASQVLRPTFDPQLQRATSSTAAAVPTIKDAAPFVAALNVIQSLRSLPGAPGVAAR